MRKNVFLYGINTVNLGDDLFFKIILERYPNTVFIMRAPAIYRKIFSDYKNCLIITDEDPIIQKIIRICRLFHIPENILIYCYIFIKYRISIFLITGGSLFIEGNSNIPNLLKKLKIIKLFKRKLKIAILGSNFGPYKTEEWKKSVNTAFEYVDDICFRDKYSFELFAGNKKIRCANDIVMELESKQSTTNGDKIVCVNIRSVDNWPTLRENKEKYIDTTAKIIEKFQNEGYYITLMSFCRHYGDEEITNELYDRLKNKETVRKIYYRGNIEDCLDELSKATSIIATRFHAIILGLVYNLKIIPISYSIKSENMLKTLDVWEEIYDYKSYCEADENIIIQHAIKGYMIDKSNNKQFQFLDTYLKNNDNTNIL